MQNISSNPQVLKVSKSKINWKYQFLQYGLAVCFGAILFLALSVYLFYRRGYYDFYIVNKIFAGVSAVLFGVVLLIGPLSRIFSFPDRYVQYRKELGIVAFFLAFIHGIVSLFFLPAKFPLSLYFLKLNWPFIFGLAAIIIMAAIFFISNDRVMVKMGREKWWRYQYWGARIAFSLVFLHVFIMKWGGWIKWYQVGGGNGLARPEWPGAGLLIGWFMLFVVLFRLAEFISPKLGKLAWCAGIVLLPAIYIATFWWGRMLVS